MTVYNHERSQPLKWIIAIVIFILAMTVTFNDAYGVWVPKSDKSAATDPSTNNGGTLAPADYGDGSNTESLPPQVPEPATVILVGSGLAAIYLMRRRKN